VRCTAVDLAGGVESGDVLVVEAELERLQIAVQLLDRPWPDDGDEGGL
jgi:hypothetical protein